jgi:homoserine kinase
MAVRDALRFAVGKCGLELVELDEKSLPDQAARGLGLSAAEIDAQLKAFAPAAGKPWRKEQKLAALAAWIAAASRGA